MKTEMSESFVDTVLMMMALFFQVAATVSAGAAVLFWVLR